MTSRMATVQEIFEITTKPVIYDGDTGGLPEHFAMKVKTLERLGVSAVVIEDKVGAKKNSLFGTDVDQTQDEPAAFAEKISIGQGSSSHRRFSDHRPDRVAGLGKEPADAIVGVRSTWRVARTASSSTNGSADPTNLFEVLAALSGAHPSRGRSQCLSAGDGGELASGRSQHRHLRQPSPPIGVPGDGRDRQLDPTHGRALEADQNCLPIAAALELIPGNR